MTIAAAPSLTLYPFAIASGAVPPSRGANWSLADATAHYKTSDTAAIAQNKAFGAVENTLLQKVDQ